MSKERFAEEFKQEAVRQVVERGYTVADVARRLGVSVQSLYKWVKAYAPNATDRYEAEIKEVRRENLTLKAELRRAQKEHDILKKQPRTSPKTRSEVRLHFAASGPVSSATHVSAVGCITQWLLRLVGKTPFAEPWMMAGCWGSSVTLMRRAARPMTRPRIVCDLREVGERVGKPGCQDHATQQDTRPSRV